MSDPTEEALRAIENKYFPLVMDGKCLMPFYPREDVRLMVSAAIAAEREACAKISNDIRGKNKNHDFLCACDEIEYAIRARGTA